MEANSDRLRNAIGLAMKAGRVKSGDFIVEKLTRAGELPLVLLDGTASDNTREKYQKLCASKQTELLSVCELGKAIGKPGRMVACVTDENFKNMIIRAASRAE